jgi:antitoxin component YwqK of YwqJK toxin-antitoxin module
MKNRLTLAFLLCSLVCFAQTGNDSTRILDLSIPEYDSFCAIMGGDSVRLQNGQKATGLFKDNYPNGRLKHKGYYDNGRIVTVFTNYYESGQEERNFKAKTDKKGTLEVYYPDGKILSRVEWIDGQSLKWEDFYQSGQAEFAEEFSKNLDYYLYMRFWYEDGKPQVIFELTDEKSRMYSYKEYYPNGQIKESGNKMHNASLDDYQMDGLWQYFNEDGKLTLEETYTRGQLIDDKSYE